MTSRFVRVSLQGQPKLGRGRTKNLIGDLFISPPGLVSVSAGVVDHFLIFRVLCTMYYVFRWIRVNFLKIFSMEAVIPRPRQNS